MPTVTVLAPDSALAMDEVIRQLGDNAYIVATHTRDGQVEILATNEPTQIQPQRKRTTSVSFADAISEQLTQAGGATSLMQHLRMNGQDLPQADPDLGPAHSATIVTMPQSRKQSTDGAPVGNGAPETITHASTSTPLAHQQLEAAGIAAAQAPQQHMAHASPSPAAEPDAALRPLLREIADRLTQLEAAMAPQPQVNEISQDPFEKAGFSTEIVRRLAPSRTDPQRRSQFVDAMTKTLVAPDPLAILQAPIVVVVGASGAGKTVLAGKIAALMLETETTREVELISLSETPTFANAPLSIYARMLSIGHQNWAFDQFAPNQARQPNATRIFDTNLDPEKLGETITELRMHFGHEDVAVIIALPVGISPSRARAQLMQYEGLDPKIALTKLDECELSPQEASTISENGIQIAWLSGTCALTETMAPATEEMMTEFLNGLLADHN